MKICIICARLSFGGAERVAVSWANGFYRRGHEVMMISNLNELITYQLDSGIDLRQLVSDSQNKIKKWSSSFRFVRKNLKKKRPDVVIGVMPMCSFIARVASLGLNVPVIATEHNSFERPDSAPFTYWNRKAKFSLNKLYHHITVLTKADANVIGKRLINIHVMPNPLALVPVQTVPRKEKFILAVGRLDSWHVKGFDVLIRAWAKLVYSSLFLVSSEGWKLQIAGTGSEESLNYLKQLCKENGVEDSVEFLGFRKDVEKLYQEASVFVLSSRYEGFGLVLIEAMSQGCACVACDYKGRQREIMSPEGQVSSFKFQVPGVDVYDTGICCDSDDVESLAAGIRKMIEDDDYRESVRAKAIERSYYYSIDNTIDRWEELLNKIVY